MIEDGEGSHFECIHALHEQSELVVIELFVIVSLKYHWTSDNEGAFLQICFAEFHSTFGLQSRTEDNPQVTVDN